MKVKYKYSSRSAKLTPKELILFRRGRGISNIKIVGRFVPSIIKSIKEDFKINLYDKGFYDVFSNTLLEEASKKSWTLVYATLYYLEKLYNKSLSKLDIELFAENVEALVKDIINNSSEKYEALDLSLAAVGYQLDVTGIQTKIVIRTKKYTVIVRPYVYIINRRFHERKKEVFLIKYDIDDNHSFLSFDPYFYESKKNILYIPYNREIFNYLSGLSPRVEPFTIFSLFLNTLFKHYTKFEGLYKLDLDLFEKTFYILINYDIFYGTLYSKNWNDYSYYPNLEGLFNLEYPFTILPYGGFVGIYAKFYEPDPTTVIVWPPVKFKIIKNMQYIKSLNKCLLIVQRDDDEAYLADPIVYYYILSFILTKQDDVPVLEILDSLKNLGLLYRIPNKDSHHLSWFFKTTNFLPKTEVDYLLNKIYAFPIYNSTKEEDSEKTSLIILRFTRMLESIKKLFSSTIIDYIKLYDIPADAFLFVFYDVPLPRWNISAVELKKIFSNVKVINL